MKKNKKTESGFELFERMTNGRFNSLYSQNPEIPIILVTKTAINFGRCAYEKIGLNEKNRYVLAKKDDVFYKVLGEEVTMQSARKLLGQISAMKVGDIVEVVVKRGDKEVAIKLPLQQRMDKHIFEELDQISEQQKFFRDVWKKNL